MAESVAPSAAVSNLFGADSFGSASFGSGSAATKPPRPEAAAAQSGVPFKQAFTADGTTAAAADPSHGQATPFDAASEPAAPKLPNSPGQNRPQVAVVPLHQAASTLEQFRPGDNGNAGGAAASGASKFP